MPADRVPRWLKFLSVVFAGISGCRRFIYQKFPSKVYNAPVPVIVVGNIFVGGTGKTPLVIALASLMKQRGLSVGIISRGYGGKARQWPLQVSVTSDPHLVGDEPVLIASRTGCPVVVAPKRAMAIKTLMATHPDIDVILSDDGLQHYAMARDMECVVIDAQRRFGNAMLLPAGPLREKVSRLNDVDFLIANGDANPEEFAMTLIFGQAYDIHNPENKKALTEFIDEKVHAIAGIGNPQRFFAALEELGISAINHPFADHFNYQLENLCFEDGATILMTEKDAVKCRKFPLKNTWVVPVNARLDYKFEKQFLERLAQILDK